MADDLDIIHTIFEHRLQQADLDRILNALSLTDRNELINKIGDLLNRISALVEVSNSVSSTLSLDIILPRLMEVVTEALNADRSTVFLYDAEAKELFSRFAQRNSVGEIRFPGESGIAGSLFQSGTPLIIPDAYADARFNPGKLTARPATARGISFARPSRTKSRRSLAPLRFSIS